MLLTTLSTAWAQDVKVQIVPKTTNFPPTLVSYIDNPESYLSIRITNTSAMTQRVYLQLEMECQFSTDGNAPMRLYTEEHGNTRPYIELRPNETRSISDRTTIEEHFSGRLTTNVKETDLANLIRLPEGQYNICVKACRWAELVNVGADNVIDQSCLPINICYTGSAPELITPIMGQVINTEPQRQIGKFSNVGINMPSAGINVITPTRLLNLRWTSVITNCPQNANFDYHLKIVKVDPNQNINDAIDRGAVILAKNCGKSTLYQFDTLRNLKVHLERGATYAVQVQAVQRVSNGSVMSQMKLGNDGKSQVVAFTWGQAEYKVLQRLPKDTILKKAVPNTSVNVANVSSRPTVVNNIRPHYIVAPFSDKTTFDSVKAKFSGESELSEVSKNLLYNTDDGVPVLDPKKATENVSWMPIRSANVHSVHYSANLYEYMGSPELSTSRKPIKSKSMNGDISTIGYFGIDNDTKIVIADTTWHSVLEQGKKYILTVSATVGYRYENYVITSTTHYVNGNEADVERDTTRTIHYGDTSYSSTITFQWGTDSALLDRIVPAQFAHPIDRTGDDWNDTSFLHLSEPTIYEQPMHHAFDMQWSEAKNINVDDTAVYTLNVYSLAAGKDIAAAIKETPLYKTDLLTDTKYAHGILDSLSKDKNYVFRLQTSVKYKSSASKEYLNTQYKMLNDGWSHPIVMKFVDTVNYSDAVSVTNSCFPGDTAKLSKKKIAPKVKDLVNYRIPIKMGRFKLVIQKATLKDSTYSGEGYMMWNPLTWGCGIKVSFSDLRINKDTIAISGTARSITTDKKNYLNLGLEDSKFGAGFDMVSNESASLLNEVSGYLGSTGKDIKKWYDIINNTSNVLSETIHGAIDGTGTLGVVTTPIRISDGLLGAESDNVAVALNDAYFSTTTAQMNLLAFYFSHDDNMYIPLIATNVCMDPKSFIPDSIGDVHLFMARNYSFTLSEGYTLRLKMPTKMSEVNDGTHLTFDHKGFKEFAIDAELEFGTKDLPDNKMLAVDMSNDGRVQPDKPVKAHLYTAVRKWNNWVATISMDPFTVVGCEEFTFVPTGKGIYFDHSADMTPDIKFPENYIADSKKKEWKGFYLDQFTILLPQSICNTFVDLAGEEAVEQKDSMVVYSYGANGQLTDSTAYILPNTRISCSARDLILDNDGITVNVSANNLLKLETKNGGGWAFSLDTVGVYFRKSSYKNSYIKGRVKIPLFSGDMKYSVALGTDSIDFAIKPNGKLKLDLFVADVELDEKSTHFRIVHDFGGNTYKTDMDGNQSYTYKNQNATTRVDLTLNGKLTIDFKRFDVPVSLPGIKFENMYMRNFTSKDVEVSYKDKDGKVKKKKVESYKFGNWDFNIGNWSKASPQKYVGVVYPEPEEPLVDALALAPEEDNDTAAAEPILSGSIGGFKYSIMTLDPAFEKKSGGVYKVGIKFGGSMELGIGDKQSVGASVGFGIWCDVNTKDFDVGNFSGNFDSASLSTNIGPLSVAGRIIHTRNDSLFGSSWRGMLDVKIMDVIEVKMGAGFGTNLRTDKTDSSTYDWWYLEGVVDMGTSSPFVLGPLTINGFGGAFAYNMQPSQELASMSAKDLKSPQGSFTDRMVSSTGTSFKPQYDAWIARAGISMILTADASTLNADGILNLRISNGHFAGISLQVNANILSSYDKDKKEASSAAISVASFIDYSRGQTEGEWTLNFSACVTADINLESFIKGSDFTKNLAANIKYPTSSIEAAKDGQGGALSKYIDKVKVQTYNYDSLESKKSQLLALDSTSFDSLPGVGAGAKLQIPIDLYVHQYASGEVGPKSGKNTEWFFAIGRPAYEDRVTFDAHLDLVVCKVKTVWTMYFMTGNYFPDGFALPDIPDEVQKFLGSKYEKAKNGRTMPTFDKAGGVAFGASFYAGIEIDMLLFLKANVYIGFDAALLNTNGQGCSGYSKIGKNNFYAMGQAYAMIDGEMGLSLNLGFWKGKLKLVEGGAGALLQAGGPNPTWAYGILAFKCRVLGGIININTSVDFSLGHVCLPGTSDPLANVKLFQNVTPAQNTLADAKKNTVSAYSQGVIVSNLPWNEDVLLSADEKHGKGTTTRKFRFVVDKNECGAWYVGRDNTPTDKSPVLNLKFTPSTQESNTQFFEWTKGGLPENSNILMKFRGRALEWRKTDGNDLSDVQRKTDYYYDISTNYAKLVNKTDPTVEHWRDPVYTDNKVTKHREWHQDTMFYITTQKMPDNLRECVVFTWPYNGDPHFPVDEFYQSGGRYRALIYLFQDRDFLNKLDEDGREVKAFLIERGIGANNNAHACDYIYHKNGYLGSSTPCIEIVLPKDFGIKYTDYDMAIRLMMVKKSDYNATLKQMQDQAEGKTVAQQKKFEKQSRDVDDLKRKLQQQKDKYTKTETFTTYDPKTGRKVKKIRTVYDEQAASQDIALTQLKEAVTNYDTMADTAMLYARKMLANDYALCMTSGSPIYTLYFRLYSPRTTYSQILTDNYHTRFSGLFTTINTVQTGSTIRTKQELHSDYNSHEVMRFAYWFAPYKPTDPTQYKTGTILPPIVYAALNFNNAGTPRNTTEQYPKEFDLYCAYVNNLIDMEKAIKNTYAKTDRPVQDDDQFKLGNPKWTTNNMPNASDRTTLHSIFAEGFARQTNDNFINLDTRILLNKNGNVYETAANVGKKSFPEGSGSRVTTPCLLKVELTGTKWRYDSTNIGRFDVQKKMSDGQYVTRPQDSYVGGATIVDGAVAAMLSDIGKYHDFYQELYDNANYFHSKGWSHKRDQIEHLYKSAYRRNLFTTDFPYSFTKSCYVTWWLSHWRSQYYAGQLKRKDTKYDNMKNLSIPRASFNLDGNQSLYWMDYVIHYDKIAYKVNDTKGTLYEDLFTEKNDPNNGKFGGWRTTAWFNSISKGGKAAEYPESYKNGRLQSTANQTKLRRIALNLYYVHGGSNSSDYNIFGKMADKAKQSSTTKTYEFIANQMIETQYYYYYSMNEATATKLRKNAGLTFHELSDSKERDKLDGSNVWENKK